MKDRDASAETSGKMYGSDLILEGLIEADIPFVALNPGATIRGFHESLVYYTEFGGPQPVLCTHEEIAVGLAHGYTKACGKTMAVGLHNVVGLQHAAMPIFNAWCDRVPVVLIGGTGPMRQSRRRAGIDWIHTAYLQGSLVRDFVKWDGQVFGVESIQGMLRRAVQTAENSPPGPVYLCIDVEDQEEVVDARTGELRSKGARSQVDVAEKDVDALVELMERAEFPVFIVDHYNPHGTSEYASKLATVSEQWAVPVIDLGGRFNMPTAHEFCLTAAGDALLSQADVVIALDVRDLHGALRSSEVAGMRGPHEPIVRPIAKIISVSDDLEPRSSWVPDTFAPVECDFHVPVPSRIFVERLLLRKSEVPSAEVVRDRGHRLREIRREIEEGWHLVVEQQWDMRPISTARLCAEIRSVLEDDRWILANSSFVDWPYRLWDFEGERLTHVGRSGGEGLGYGLSASVGVALAAKEMGKFALDIQGDGDLMFVPGALWTAAAYKVPLLVIVHNNRGYYQDYRHQEDVSDWRGRGGDSRRIGIEMTEPPIDFSGLARGMGVWAVGPIADPLELRTELDMAVRHIRETGGPALLDVISAAR